MSGNLKILIVGSGFITEHYLKVIADCSIECVVVGRGVENVNKLSRVYENIKFHSGGLKKYLAENAIDGFTHFFNLVNIENCVEVSELLLRNGAKRIFLEKPGFLNYSDLDKFSHSVRLADAEVVIGYNRRFFDSVAKLIELSIADGGIESLHFEFTEWAHRINVSDYSSKALEKWITSNSSHVLDTVFYLIGLPESISANIYGEDRIEWHKSGSIFVGSGVSVNNIPFSYSSNWNSAGRWAIEVTTATKRYYLKPMETLSVQKKGEIVITDIDLDNNDKSHFKEGIHDMVLSYLKGDYSRLLSLDEQAAHLKLYDLIGNYK